MKVETSYSISNQTNQEEEQTIYTPAIAFSNYSEANKVALTLELDKIRWDEVLNTNEDPRQHLIKATKAAKVPKHQNNKRTLTIPKNRSKLATKIK